MQRKKVLAYLLFSLFICTLLTSCYVPSSGELSKLAGEHRYAELERKTETMLSKRIGSVPLFYRAVALQGLDKSEQAYHVLNLYFAMAEDDDERLEEAHRMMCSLALEAGAPNRTLGSARWLEGRSLLEERSAGSYYQALLMLDQKVEASRVFHLYLKDTIDAYSYAQMVLLSLTEREDLEASFAPLAPNQQLTLLQSVASGTLSQQRATLLLNLALPLEQAFEDKGELSQVYRLLQTLYGYADMRVQQRKYTTLSQNF